MQSPAPPPAHPTPQMTLTASPAVAPAIPGRPAAMAVRPAWATIPRTRPAGFATGGGSYISSPLGGGVPPGGFVFAMPPMPSRGLPDAVGPDDRPDSWPPGTGSGAGALPVGGLPGGPPGGDHAPPLRPPGEIAEKPPGVPGAVAVPEPASAVLLGLGVVIVAVLEVSRRAGRENISGIWK